MALNGREVVMEEYDPSWHLDSWLVGLGWDGVVGRVRLGMMGSFRTRVCLPDGGLRRAKIKESRGFLEA